MASSPVNRDNVHHRNNDNPLHNFSFLKWGHKSHANSVHRSRRSIDYDRTREMVCDVDRRDRGGLGSDFDEERVDEMEVEVEGKEKLWNLRPRKTSGLGKNGSQIGMNGGGGCSSAKGGDGFVNNGEGVMNEANAMPKSMRLRGMVEGANGGVEMKKKKERAKLWISLSKEEIEEDIFILTGSRPARRPKKRPRTVQKQLDIVFPGLSLLGATAESFKIPNSPPKK